jgi:hypothetical protein
MGSTEGYPVAETYAIPASGMMDMTQQAHPNWIFASFGFSTIASRTVPAAR